MIAAVLWLAAAMPPGSPNLCTLCHPDVRVEFEQSIHAGEEVVCTSCHGGDPSSSAVEGAHRRDFRGRIRRRDVPALCASCHADGIRMGPYNLSTDQYALYQTSHHGLGLARGDENVAVCTDCHGVHRILRRDDARSGVHPTNIPATCARCHSDSALMARYGHRGDPYADFMASKHGEALAERRNASAPDCSRCHGAHGATPPGVGDVNKVCGQCHARARAYFLESRHRPAMDDARLPECASCHDHHRVLAAGLEMLDRSCLTCHEAGSGPVEMAARMKTLYATASDDLRTAEDLVGHAAAIPLYVEDYQARLEEGKTSLIEALPAMHALDVSVVEHLTGRARSIGHEVRSEIQGKLEGRKWRRVGLLVFWFYLLVTLAALVRYRRQAAGRTAS